MWLRNRGIAGGKKASWLVTGNGGGGGVEDVCMYVRLCMYVYLAIVLQYCRGP